MDMHLFDEEATEERALCGAETSADYRRSVTGYLEDRLNEARVGTVCELCKGLAVPFAQAMAVDLEAEGFLGEAQDYRQLAEKLASEIQQYTPGG